MPGPAVSSTPTTGPSVVQASLQDVDLSYEHRRVLDGLSVTFPPGVVCGLIGENGAGKSTVLRLLAGVERPDTGTVCAPAGDDLGFLSQDLPWDLERTVGEVIDAALASLRSAQTRLRALEAAMAEPGAVPTDSSPLLGQYAAAVETFERHGGHGADARMDEAFAALSIPELAREGRGRRLAALSGGQRRRVHLATLLGVDPPVLLLDEPTNDLDDPTVAWLATRLRARPAGAVTVVASHDRAFLDDVTEILIALEGGTARRFTGGYRAFRAAVLADRARLPRPARSGRTTWPRPAPRRPPPPGRWRRVANDATATRWPTTGPRGGCRPRCPAGCARPKSACVAWWPTPPPSPPLNCT